MAEALYLSGHPINWLKPPKATHRVKWSNRTTGGHVVQGSFRSICALNRLNNLAKARFGTEIQVIQSAYNASVPASAGTHNEDACFDLWIPGVNPWTQQRFFRRNGFPGWYRHPPLFGNHYHGFVLPVHGGRDVSDDFHARGFHVGEFVDGGVSDHGRLITSSQIADVYNHAFGLKDQHRPGSDKSWWPDDIAATAFNLPAYIRRRADAQRRKIAKKKGGKK